IALSFLGGMVSIAVFVLGATALYALVRLGPWQRARAEHAGALALARAALLCALGVAGSAYWLWPVGEAAAASLRGEQPSAVLVAGSLPPASALGVLVPDLAGPPDDPTPSANLPLAWW